MGLGDRVRRLEGGDESCRECGWDGDWSGVEYEVAWDDPDADPGNLEPPEACPACGRQLEIIVTWGDLDEVTPVGDLSE